MSTFDLMSKQVMAIHGAPLPEHFRDQINYIEKEFNNLMLEDGYNTLFYFPKFKEFIKTITSETN